MRHPSRIPNRTEIPIETRDKATIIINNSQRSSHSMPPNINNRLRLLRTLPTLTLLLLLPRSKSQPIPSLPPQAQPPVPKRSLARSRISSNSNLESNSSSEARVVPRSNLRIAPNNKLRLTSPPPKTL
jgi:hypothetical protein